MTGAVRALVLLLAVTTSIGSACSRSAVRAADTAAAAADSARGVLTLVGNEPVTVLLMASRSDGDQVALSGTQVELLRRVVGLEIVVTGRRTGQLVTGAGARGVAEFEVARFEVRSADGVAAHDGVVMSTNGAFFLRGANGTELPTPQLPPSLRRMLGARVWLAGPLTSSPQSYGVIRDPR